MTIQTAHRAAWLLVMLVLASAWVALAMAQGLPPGVQICTGQYALCASSTCTPVLNADGSQKMITVNVQGGGTAQYPEMSCTCPIKTGPAIADVQGGNMQGSCTPPGKKQVWSFFAVAEHLPQAMNQWSRLPAKSKVTPQQCGASLNLGASFANCFSFSCTETASINGVRLADCRCPAGENLAGGPVAPATAFSMSAGQGDPSYCGKVPVGAPTP
jgi:hypothetical protein